MTCVQVISWFFGVVLMGVCKLFLGFFFCGWFVRHKYSFFCVFDVCSGQVFMYILCTIIQSILQLLYFICSSLGFSWIFNYTVDIFFRYVPLFYPSNLIRCLFKQQFCPFLSLKNKTCSKQLNFNIVKILMQPTNYLVWVEQKSLRFKQGAYFKNLFELRTNSRLMLTIGLIFEINFQNLNLEIISGE
eukprot:TRINITY_DN9853_c0_g1_i4.p3 TRINITY_DN9853_c0_g1~~TRINITY_DN9853_c0_g1_i4.p3  ORF type:complete len:188 (+),score=-2.18 TRINITY_DN9853_c0_g1_i4:499-1062(+)